MSHKKKLNGIYCDPTTMDKDGKMSCVYTTKTCESEWSGFLFFGTRKEKCQTGTVRCRLTENEYKHFQDFEKKE